jgi:hypothetical protein
MGRTFLWRFLLAFLCSLIQLIGAAQVKKDVLKSAEGFPGDQILEVFNRIPFIQSKDGFTLQGKYHVNPNIIMGVKRGYVDFTFEEKFSYALLYKMSILTNDFSFMAQKPFLSYETAHFHFPDFYNDTIALSWVNRGGVMVGQGADKHSAVSDSFFVLNPRGKPFFKPVTQEEYIHFLLVLLQDHIDQRQKHLDDHASRNGAPPPGVDPDNTKVMAMIEQNLKADSVWIDYYRRRIKEYTTLLASMTEAEKKQRAYAITPKVLAVQNDKQGRVKESIEGGIPSELLRNKEDASTIVPLYEFNPSFFDPKLSPGAVQLMLFRDINASFRLKEFPEKIREQFFPDVDFKAFANLMYK